MSIPNAALRRRLVTHKYARMLFNNRNALRDAVRGGNVFVAAGDYREHLTLSRDVNVRATASAMAQGGVSIAYRTPRQDVPAVTIKGGNVNFIGLKFTHGCRGQDIWNGNSALLINGPSVVRYLLVS